MEENYTPSNVRRPPLRRFIVRTMEGDHSEDHEVTAHLVFDNSSRGEGLVFRRYYNESVRTEKIAEFLNWQFYKEIEIVD